MKFKPTKAEMARNIVYALYDRNYKTTPMTEVMEKKYKKLLKLSCGELCESNKSAIAILGKFS